MLPIACEYVTQPATPGLQALVDAIPGPNGTAEQGPPVTGNAVPPYPQGQLLWHFCYPVADRTLAGALVLFLPGQADIGAWDHPFVHLLQERLAARGIASGSLAAGNLDVSQRAELVIGAFPLMIVSAISKANDPTHPLNMAVEAGRFGLVGHSAGGQAVALALGLDPTLPVSTVVALAPSDRQPHEIVPFPHGASYLVLGGVFDGDVRQPGPVGQFERIDAKTKYLLMLRNLQHSGLGPARDSGLLGAYPANVGGATVGSAQRNAWLATRSLVTDFIAWKLLDEAEASVAVLWRGFRPGIFDETDGSAVNLGSLLLPPLIRVSIAGSVGFQFPERAIPLLQGNATWAEVAPAIVAIETGTLMTVAGTSTLPGFLCDGDGLRTADFEVLPPSCPHDVTTGVRVDWDEFASDGPAVVRTPIPDPFSGEVVIPGTSLDGYSLGIEVTLNTRADLNLLNTAAWDVTEQDWFPRVGFGTADEPLLWLSGPSIPSDQGYPCAVDILLFGVADDARKSVLSTLLFDLDGLTVDDLAGMTHLYVRLSDARHQRGSALLGHAYLFHRAGSA